MKSSLGRRAVAVILLMALSLGLAASGVLAAVDTPTPNPNHMAVSTPVSANPCDLGMAATPADHGMMTGTPAAGTDEPFDLLFIDLMMPHHESAVAMAQVALVRGEHQEIRDLAQEIIKSQQHEIDQMTAWRNAWFPGAPRLSMDQMMAAMDKLMATSAGMMGTPEANMSMGAMESMMNAASETQMLCAASGSFDETFMEMMIPHHQSAVAMAQVALQRAAHPELITLAKTIVASQDQEISQMTNWLASWYGATPMAEQ